MLAHLWTSNGAASLITRESYGPPPEQAARARDDRVALVLGVVLGITTGIVDRIFGGPNPKTIASASLESMRAQNRLIAFVARYVSVVTSEEQRLAGWLSSERTLILPGDVRYELDLSKLQPNDVTWDASTPYAAGASSPRWRSPDRTWI